MSPRSSPTSYAIGRNMKIAIGSDHRGYNAKQSLISFLEKTDHQVDDVGANGTESVDYPGFAAAVARKVSKGRADYGILICGTGIGMCIAANKFPGVRAAICHDGVSAHMSRRHNNANVLCLPAATDDISDLVATWLGTEFEGGRHAKRIEKISKLEATMSGEKKCDTKPCWYDLVLRILQLIVGVGFIATAICCWKFLGVDGFLMFFLGAAGAGITARAVGAEWDGWF